MVLRARIVSVITARGWRDRSTREWGQIDKRVGTERQLKGRGKRARGLEGQEREEAKKTRGWMDKRGKRVDGKERQQQEG
jgi:hypothetical protein